jgi:hypothetical protein
MIAALRGGAVGRGGRHRPVGSDVERMRVAITRRIRAAVEQIGSHHPGLGAHLRATVRTGYLCSYALDGALQWSTAEQGRDVPSKVTPEDM